jgi:hypothetical protein
MMQNKIQVIFLKAQCEIGRAMIICGGLLCVTRWYAHGMVRDGMWINKMNVVLCEMTCEKIRRTKLGARRLMANQNVRSISARLHVTR